MESILPILFLCFVAFTVVAAIASVFNRKARIGYREGGAQGSASSVGEHLYGSDCGGHGIDGGACH